MTSIERRTSNESLEINDSNDTNIITNTNATTVAKKKLISFQADKENTTQVEDLEDDLALYINPPKDDYDVLRQKLLPNEVESISEELKVLNKFSHEQLTFLLLNNHNIVEYLKREHPDLFETLLGGHLSSDDMKMLFIVNSRRQKLYLKLIENSESDDSDLDENNLISERIRKRQLRANLVEAYQYIPQSFIDPSMAYINCTINGVDLIAMLDTGSQDTFMSESCAKKLDLTNMIDKSWAGDTYGLGISRQLGRIHMIAITISGATILSSVSISMDHKDIIIGLNIIKTHKCQINLERNEFYIGSRNVSTSIMSDEDLPKHLKSSIEPPLSI